MSVISRAMSKDVFCLCHSHVVDFLQRYTYFLVVSLDINQKNIVVVDNCVSLQCLRRSRRDSLAAFKQVFLQMNWLILISAGLCEVGFTYCLGRAKEVIGSEWWSWIAAFSFFYVLSAVLLAKATQTIALGIAYPVWTGIGAAGAVIIGIFIFREPASFWRLFFLTTLIGSIIGLKALS